MIEALQVFGVYLLFAAVSALPCVIYFAIKWWNKKIEIKNIDV